MWQFNPYSIPLLISTLPLIVIFHSVWPRRAEPTIRIFLVFLAFVFGVLLAYSIEHLSATVQGILFWNRVEYLFLPIPVLYLLLVFAYTGHLDWLTRKRIALLLIIPALQCLAAWTNDFHHLNWSTTGTDTVGSIVLFRRTYGPIFYIGMIYLYSLMIAAYTLLVGALMRLPSNQRRQIWALLLAGLCPLIAQTLTVLHINPIPDLDLNGLGFCFGVIPLSLGLFRQPLFEIVPAAHDLVIRSMTDALLVLDTRDRVVDVNPAAEQFLGQPTSALLSQPIDHLLPALPLAHVGSQQTTRVEIVFDRNGEKRIYDAQISPLPNQIDTLRGKVIVLRDITEVKAAETALQQTMAALQRRNAELDAYDHTVAHDLRGPISVIAGYADLMLTDAVQPPPDIARNLKLMHTSAMKMNDIVNNLLLLASMRDASDIIAPVSMAPVVSAAIERLETKIAERGVEMIVDTNLPTVQGQAAWLEEVFTNLIDNAVKYIGKSNPSPRISVVGYEQNGRARFEIRDNGIGIAPEALPSLFEMSTRARPDEAEGAGLGLSIVRQIIQKLNGEIGVESRPGAGSTFWLALPLA